MKNFLSFFGWLLLFTGGTFSLFAQEIPPTPYDGTPPTFMTFDASYVKCRYGDNWQSCNQTNYYWKNMTSNPAPSNWQYVSAYGNYNNATTGITNFSHRFITDPTATDPCMCYQVGSSYIHEKCLPVGGWGPGEPIDTVIQIGGPNYQGTGSQSIEYWFVPDTNESVLLVMFSFAQEKANNHDTWYNPYFYIEVMDENYDLLDLGYYLDAEGNPRNDPNLPYYWPYSRFLIVPEPIHTNQNCTIPYCLTTPSVYNYNNDYGDWFVPRTCPNAQWINQVPVSHEYDCEWSEYKPIAFNLTKQARNGETVVFRVKTHACQASFHWAYGYFTAKMVPGFIKVDACGGDVITLKVPNGFRPDSYSWYGGADSASAFLVDLAMDNGVVMLDLTDPDTRVYPYYRCEMKSYTGIPFNYEAHINLYDLLPDFTYEQLYEDNNYKVQFRDNSIIRTRKPAATAGGTEDTSYQQTHWIQWFAIQDGQTERFATNDTAPVYVFENVTPESQISVMMVIEDSMHTCSDTIIKSIHLDLSLGIDDYTLSNSLFLYPNPSSRFIDVKFSQNIRIGELKVFDIYGKLLQTTKMNGNPTRINISALPDGVYFVRAITEKGIVNKSFIKK